MAHLPNMSGETLTTLTMAYFTSEAKVVFTPRAEDVSWDGRKILAVMLLDFLCL